MYTGVYYPTYKGPETPTGCAMLAHQSHGIPDMLKLPNSGPNGPQLTLVGPFDGLSDGDF